MLIHNIKGLRKLITGSSECSFHKKNKKALELLYDLFKTIQKKQSDVRYTLEDLNYSAINSYHELPMQHLNSNILPKFIFKKIKKDVNSEFKYQFLLYDKYKIELNFYCSCEINKELLNDIEQYIKKIWLWLLIAYTYNTTNCSEQLTIYFFIIDEKKLVPSTADTIISADHVNTAYTTSCVKNGSIVLYRKEEWFKVFIHETFHVLGLDFSHNLDKSIHDDLQKVFPINSEYNLYEAYTETWAEFINIVFVYYFSQNEKDMVEIKKQKVIDDLYALIKIESSFSAFQVIKILDFMNLNYEDLYRMDRHSAVKRNYYYKEKTNVFSYFIVKSMFLFFYDDFLLWCDKNNTNLIKFSNYRTVQKKFISLILQCYKHDNYIEFLSCIKKIYDSFIKSHSSYPVLLSTMRMSIVEN